MSQLSGVEDTNKLLEENNELHQDLLAASWARFLRKYWGIRRRQLIVHSAGEALKLATKVARDRLSKTYEIKR